MNRYKCTVSDKNGKILKFIRPGSSPATVQAELQKEDYFPISIRDQGGKSTRRQVRSSRTKPSTIAEFTALLSMLLDSGLSVKDGLEILKSITKDIKVNALVWAIEKDLKAGSSFYSSIRNIGPSLPVIYSSMVKVGETTGDLAFVFRKINNYLIRQKKIREKLVSSLIYPVIVLLVAVLSMILISTFIIPKISEMFIDLGSGVPDEVKQTLSFSRGIFTVFLIIIPLIAISGFCISVIRKRNSNFACTIDWLKLKIPFIGSFSEDNIFLNILFTFDALTSCGVTVEDALDEVTSNADNTAVREALNKAHEKVLRGISLSEALGYEKIIPTRITKWIAVGERTGSMGKVFVQLSDYYENELEKKSTRFMSFIEPALIIFTGLIVFGIVMMVIIPLFSTFGTILE
ncbi:MAG: type II secretion system F family protein [Spirochaetia bacterium]|jgi:type IV pilus assembly protein PilC|nr:type II secretion system F family protein [Spirochaetia bacterium]